MHPSPTLYGTAMPVSATKDMKLSAWNVFAKVWPSVSPYATDVTPNQTPFSSTASVNASQVTQISTANAASQPPRPHLKTQDAM